jgi:beta-glucosidase
MIGAVRSRVPVRWENVMRKWFTRRQFSKLASVAALAASIKVSSTFAQTASAPPKPAGPSPDERAGATEGQMTDEERFSLIVSLLGPASIVPRDPRIPADVKNVSAGYTPGVPRLGIPALQSSDASIAVTNPGYRPDDKGATTFPASILVGSSFNPQLARVGGVAIGREARIRGFNIMLAGGMNLTRDVPTAATTNIIPRIRG